MRIQFLGAAGTVTGSRYLLESNAGSRILIDSGLFQGLKRLRLKNWDKFPIDPASLEAVVLTHAHVDHSGYLPRLVREGFRGKIYCTPATKELCRILLLDAAMIMEEEAAYANQHGFSKHHPALPLYTAQDVAETLPLFEAVAFHEKRPVAGFEFEFSRAGHILGASHLRVEGEGSSIVFSGDLGRQRDLLMLSPEPAKPADYLVVESTYGDRTHPDEDPEALLEAVIRETVGRGGSVLIPVFAVGRAQFLLFMVSELKRLGRIPHVPVFLDSPMALDVMELYRTFPEDHRLTPEQCKQLCSAATYVRTVDDSKWLMARKDSRIILSASGMATGGRVLHHLKAMVGQKENTVLFSGFQAVGTRGATMVSGAKEVKIHGEYVPIRCKVMGLASFSAHADYREVIAWLQQSNLQPKTCFITHGEPGASDAFRIRLQDELKYTCQIPQLEESFTL